MLKNPNAPEHTCWNCKHQIAPEGEWMCRMHASCPEGECPDWEWIMPQAKDLSKPLPRKHAVAPVNRVCRTYEKLIKQAKDRKAALKTAKDAIENHLAQVDEDIQFLVDELKAVKACVED